MKRSRTHSRKSAVVTSSRWVAYATAGAASAFIGANAAEASIHYSGLINQNFGGDGDAKFPLDPAGGSLAFSHQIYTNSSHFQGGSGFVRIFAAAGGSIKGGFVTCPYTTVGSAFPLRGGQPVSGGPFVADAGLMRGWILNGFCGWFDQRGRFERGVAFVAFKFSNGNGDQYGWARIKSQGPPVNKFTLVDYAYGDIGDPVRAGQKSNTNSAALESLGGLALGATALLAWRKRRMLVSQQS